MKRSLVSWGILLASLGLAYGPLPGSQQEIVVVSGTELQEPLEELESRFEADYPNIDLELEFQGSQDIVNNYIDRRFEVKPTVLIPANGVILTQLEARFLAQTGEAPFYGQPQPIAKTLLVGIAWPERGQVLFGNGPFEWQRLREAMNQGNWQAIGGQAAWGSFDFVTTDPTRSNSGQLTLALFAQSVLGTQPVTSSNLNAPAVTELVSLLKRSVYQPPRSTDILLREFIAKGPNDADVATVYESIALYRWPQSSTSQNKPYQLYYPSPTIETVSTAAIARQDVSDREAQAAQKFIDFLREEEQQQVFVRYGFRPAARDLDLAAVPNSPWAQSIPGARVDPGVTLDPPPDPQAIDEIQRLWERAK
ncbi:MAG: ABC transporter substrate-binding protein [Chloroflexaceae bacterium]|nr:ABC transporter substrate-binding protein [Chloroflexaceae bacterium]